MVLPIVLLLNRLKRNVMAKYKSILVEYFKDHKKFSISFKEHKMTDVKWLEKSEVQTLILSLQKALEESNE